MHFYSYLVDKKLEKCTGSDLEAIVAGCFRRHKLWGEASSVRVRSFRDAGHQDPTVMLPGGRWAIVFSLADGNALAVDLHSHEHRSCDLFRLEDRPVDVRMVVQTQEAGCCTEVNMAVLSTYADDPVDHIQIWHIEPSYDSKTGLVLGLQATLLSSFSGGPRSMATNHTLSGCFLAYLSYSQDYRVDYTVAIDWAKANGRGDNDKIPKHFLPLIGHQHEHESPRPRVGETLINFHLRSDRISFILGIFPSPKRHATYAFGGPLWLRTMGSALHSTRPSFLRQSCRCTTHLPSSRRRPKFRCLTRTTTVQDVLPSFPSPGKGSLYTCWWLWVLSICLRLQGRWN